MQTWLTEIVSEIANFDISYYFLGIIIILAILMLILNLGGEK